MTPDQIRALAKQAGFDIRDGLPVVRHSNGSWVGIGYQLTEFARLVREQALDGDAQEVEPEITQDYLKEVLDYSETTGVFTWKKSVGKCRPGDKAGYADALGYVQIGLADKLHRAHRLAWMYVYGAFPDDFIDHIDGCKGNNAILNLRSVTHAENLLNQVRPRRDNTSGYMGVGKNGSGWRAVITVSGRRISLGTYATPEEASIAYEAQKKILLKDLHV